MIFAADNLETDFTACDKRFGRRKNLKAVFFNKISHKKLFNMSNHCSINKCHDGDYKLNRWKKEICK